MTHPEPVYDGNLPAGHERTIGPGPRTVAFPDKAASLLFAGFGIATCPNTGLTIPECSCTPCCHALAAKHRP